jgi:hypothetical protein
MAKPITSLVGNKYSRLTVESQAESRKSSPTSKSRAYWNCVCDCGIQLEVRQDGLTGGGTQSCGCFKIEQNKAQKGKRAPGWKPRPMEDLVGKSFGRLSIISKGKTSTTPKGRTLNYWTCKCLCGTVKDIESGQLRQGKTKSCGCVPPDFADSNFMSKTDLFLSRAVEAHGDKYDYSLVDFQHSQEDVHIVCSIHGVFSQKPWNHLLGSGCPSCSRVERIGKSTYTFKEELMCGKHQVLYPVATGCADCRKALSEKNLAEFLEKASGIHGNKYDYSKVKFTLMTDRVTIICPEHGEFEQTVSLHLQGNNCTPCAYKLLTKTTEEFILQAKEKHGDFYDYSETDYVYCYDKVKITCPNHGKFYQKPSAHLNGQRCTKCAGESRALKQHWNYIKRCELNPELSESDGTLYLLEMTHKDEIFLKIGISSEFTKRAGHYREYGISFEILSRVESTAIQTAIWERDILKDIRGKGFKYIPEVSFKGWTECATIENKEYILKLFEDLKNV